MDRKESSESCWRQERAANSFACNQILIKNGYDLSSTSMEHGRDRFIKRSISSAAQLSSPIKNETEDDCIANT